MEDAELLVPSGYYARLAGIVCLELIQGLSTSVIVSSRRLLVAYLPESAARHRHAVWFCTLFATVIFTKGGEFGRAMLA
ncbi:MAG TPA: hypothetical protein VKQ30_12935 [Ktedonobacterales bacterium]|nr:hypothetical protein [Ktedonobacterales bacterium]